MNEKRRISHYLIITAATVLTVITGCVLTPDGDSDNTPAEPALNSVSIIEGAEINSRSLTISWSGNELSDSYRYYLDSGPPQETSEAIVLLSDLDDGDHVFAITAINTSTETESDPVVRTFTVDAYNGPGVIFSPRQISNQSTVTISLEKTPDVIAAHIVITASQNCVDFGVFTPAETFGDEVTIINFTKSGSGTFVIDLGFAGMAEGLSGDTIPVGTLTMRPVRNGTVRCDKVMTVLRTTDNEDFLIQDADYITITP